MIGNIAVFIGNIPGSDAFTFSALLHLVFASIVVASQVSNVSYILSAYNAKTIMSQQSNQDIPVDITDPVADMRLAIYG